MKSFLDIPKSFPSHFRFWFFFPPQSQSCPWSDRCCNSNWARTHTRRTNWTVAKPFWRWQPCVKWQIVLLQFV